MLESVLSEIKVLPDPNVLVGFETADDGGVYRRTNPQSNFGDWFSLIGNLQATEMHDVSYDPLAGIIISGNQDTGSAQQDGQPAEPPPEDD